MRVKKGRCKRGVAIHMRVNRHLTWALSESFFLMATRQMMWGSYQQTLKSSRITLTENRRGTSTAGPSFTAKMASSKYTPACRVKIRLCSLRLKRSPLKGTARSPEEGIMVVKHWNELLSVDNFEKRVEEVWTAVSPISPLWILFECCSILCGF